MIILVDPFLFDTDDITAVSIKRDAAERGERKLNEWASLKLVLVRTGCFSYRDQRGQALVDSTRCLLLPPLGVGETESPYVSGNTESQIYVCTPALAALGCDDVEVPRFAQVTAAMQLNHRRLLAASRRGVDDLILQELAVQLVVGALASAETPIRHAGRRATRRARRQLVEDARVLLAGNPTGISLTELARRLSCSPYHLSRVFREEAGMTLGRFRTQLRLNLALEHLGGAEAGASLADVAAACGFADHAHLTRTAREHLGMVPSELRELLT